MRMIRVVSAITGAACLVLAGVVATGSQQAASATESGASVEVSQGIFSGLNISVSQTRNLTNQVVQIRWSGATPTVPLVGPVSNSYLQIMQCWGDNPAGTTASSTPGLESSGSSSSTYGPDRTQCQYGGVGTREVNPGSLVDPLEDQEANVECSDGGVCQYTYIPFQSVTGSDPIADQQQNVYFDSNTTNELAAARTRSSGEGLAYFEVQTLRQAPGLGCGAAKTSGAVITGRACWLVIVPRDDHEVDGQLVGAQQPNHELLSSPLSASNWANRIVVPLTFAPIGNVCPIGGAERRVLGSEVATDAMTRWQPTLCASGDRIFSFSQVSEPVVANQLASSDPSLAFVDSKVAGVKDVVYAPILAGGLTFASLIERKVSGTEDISVQERAGERMPALNLNARLVAKLMTQSYILSLAAPNEPDKTTHLYEVDANGRPKVDGNGDVVLNPRSLVTDPEFLALNPAYETYPTNLMPIADVVVPVGSSKLFQLVWRYILSDPDAQTFVDGVPDEWGMRVNPYYRGQATDSTGEPRSDFPKRDETCAEPIIAGSESSILCTTGANPYSADMESAARAAGRGDDLAVTNWDGTAVPPRFKANGPAPIGSRAVLTLTTTALAERYGLAQAHLVNASGDLVAPDATSIAEAISDAIDKSTRSSAPSIISPDPADAVGDAYPLATLTYAATVPSKLSVDAALDYAAFINFASESGQRIGVSDGRLPYGYVPLPNSLSVQAAVAADDIVAQANAANTPTPSPSVSPTPTPSVTESATPTPTPSESGTDSGSIDTGSTDTGGIDTGSGGVQPSPQPSAEAPSDGPVLGDAPATVAVTAAAMGPSRLAVPILAGLGIVGLALGLLLPALARRR